ncbi:MAG TPA: MazG nucleotide pyrophosphohydrolase domain-containing protein [Patescibacteria group bacterium]|nr:MazG nucleotide pyrophosphohydrolase domain-containing protein [Patescibacteria group bacterium]
MEKEPRLMENNKKNTATTFKLLQDIQAYFCEINNIENTPQLIITYLFDEMRELAKAVEKQDKKEIGSEIADIIIFAATLANCYGNVALEESITQKLERNFHKYNPVLSKALQGRSLTPIDVLKKMKNLWDRKKDKEFIK